MCVAAANQIIRRTNAHNNWRKDHHTEPVYFDRKRLQKVLYLCQLAWMADNPIDQPLLTDDFEAWEKGPVIPLVYQLFSVYQDGNMEPIDENGHTPLNDDQKKFVNRIVDYTINIETQKIIDFTHEENGPWVKVYEENNPKVIPRESIYNYIQDRKNRAAFVKFLATGEAE